MPVNLNNSFSSRALAAGLPVVIISMIIGYLIFNLAQAERVFSQADKRIQAGIDLQKSIIFLEKIRALEKITLDTSEKEINKNMVSGAIDELKELVFQKLNAISFFYKKQVSRDKDASFKEIVNEIDNILSESVANKNFNARYMEYERAIFRLQNFDVHKIRDKSRFLSKRNEAEYLLTVNSRNITEIIEDIEQLRNIAATTRDQHGDVVAAEGEIMRGFGALKMSRERLKKQITLIKYNTLLQNAEWIKEEEQLVTDLVMLEGIAETKASGLGEGYKNKRYLKLASNAFEAAMHIHNQISSQQIVIDREKLYEISNEKSVIKLFSVIAIFLLLILSVTYFRKSSMTMNKLKLLNNSLVRSENNIRNIIELLPNIVVMQDVEGNVLMANKAFRNFYEWAEENKIKQSINLKKSGDLINKLFYSDVEKINSGKLLSTKKESFVGVDGEKKVMHLTSVPYPVNDTNSAVLTVMIDMTEIYRVRELQKISGVGYWEWDFENNKFSFSDKFYETTGMKNNGVADDFYAYLDSVVEEDRHRVIHEFYKAYETYQPLDIEHRVLSKEGVVSILHVRGNIYRRSLDDTMYMVGTVQDITVQKQAEETLKHSELKYRKLVENLNDAYFFYSYETTGQITYISPSVVTVLGYTAQEVCDSETIRHLLMKRNMIVPGVRKEADISEHVFNMDVEIMHRDNTLRYLELSEVPNYSNYGEIVGYDGIAHDVTEHKLAERELRDSEQRLRELATHLQDVRENERASIAHDIHDEIGGYLMALKMDISLLNKKLDKTDTRIHSRFQSMTQLLDVAIESTRRMITNLRPSILDELGLLEALEWQLNEFSKRYEMGVIFNRDEDSSNPKFENPEYSVDIFRIFQEILNNIAKHAEASMVTTYAAVNANSFVLSVSDDGKGIQNDIGRKPGSYGILGMQERVNKMGGEMELISDEGIGTMVILQIPLEIRDKRQNVSINRPESDLKAVFCKI